MEIQVKGKDLVVTGLCDFNLKHIFDCGQCFRFTPTDDGAYIGVAMNRALKIRQDNDIVTLFETSEADFHNIWYDYFDLGRDYGEIKRVLAKDSVMRAAVSYGDGIRILRQDLWETVISFIISASNNIPRIRGIIERFCALYGEEIEYMGDVYYSFPSIEAVSLLTKDDLAPIRAGFRDKYILDAIKTFFEGRLNEEQLRSLPTAEAKKSLMSINGIGEKVAGCILLFALSRTESFPIDVWIKRVMEHYYFDGEQTVDTISSFAKETFNQLGGFAQQYLFFYAREEKIGV